MSKISGVRGHGALVLPPSTRHGGSLREAGSCSNGECLWFSQLTTIPGSVPTLNEAKYRTYNVNVRRDDSMTQRGERKHVRGSSRWEEADWSRENPWRSPGAAPVRGSGCGIAGGHPVRLFNGGFSPPNIPQAFDGLDLPSSPPELWPRGSTQEVGFAITANHGGGYAYRLCKKNNPNGVNEACFQNTTLRFSGDTQWIHYGEAAGSKLNGTRVPIPLTRVDVGTFPKGSEWARNEIPACLLCDQGSTCGPRVDPNYTEPSGTVLWGNETVTYYGGNEFMEWAHCGVVCAGERESTIFVNGSGPHAINESEVTDGVLCPEGLTQFPEPRPGLSGFVANHSFPERSVASFSIVSHVIVPSSLEPGPYLLSWRWDCEQSRQIWQSCADIEIT